MRHALLSAALFLLFPHPLMATLEEAKAAYTRGTTLERAKNYEAALAEYRQALVEDPRYAYAHKQMGNCYYYLGDKAEALKHYELWLRVKGDDEATRAFAARLRAELGAAAPEPETFLPEGEPEAEPEERPRPRRRKRRAPGPVSSEPLFGSSFYAGGSLNVLFGNSNDLKKVYSNSSSFVDVGVYGDLHLGYLSGPGLGIEAGIEFLSRAVSASYTYDYYGYSYTYTDLYSITETTFFVEPLYRLALSRRLGLIGGVKLGYSTANIQDNYSYNYSYSYSTNQINASGSGTLIAPDLRIQFLFGGFCSLEVGGEYRFSDIGPLKDKSGSTLKVLNSAGNAEDWRLSNSGPAVRIGLNFYFTRLTASIKKGN